MNLCTDQMAMLLATPGQLYSVSYLAADAGSSVLAGQASGYVVNHGLAEEIFFMQPDLVLAGTYTTRATVQMLRRLGIPVEEFAPENSFEDIRSNLRRMGEVLGRPGRAAELIAEMDSALAAMPAASSSGRTVATYYANSYTSGGGTLMDTIITASGMVNIAAKLGYTGTARLPLEQLIMAHPDVLVDSRQAYSSPSMAEQNFVHPAYSKLADKSIHVDLPAKFTICGAPFTVEAVRLLRTAGDQRAAP